MTTQISGQQYGRWTVLNEYQLTSHGEKKWLCRCTCGTERYVLERSLRYGTSQSCGCLRKEAAERALAHDLVGQSFGELTVLARSHTYHKNGGIWWLCQCSCGNTCEVPATLLAKGRKTHCGCITEEKKYAYTDITGQRIGRLLVQYRLERRTEKGGCIWHCRCDCGNEVDVSYNNLIYAHQKSCGCQKREHEQMLNSLQTHVDGTSLEIIRSKKVPADNTTGYRGVYFIKGKYVAKIVFQKKAYYLGTYNSIEEAHEARLDAEEAIFQPTVAYHARWQAKANADPTWAAENPPQIFVDRVDDRFRICFLPVI